MFCGREYVFDAREEGDYTIHVSHNELSSQDLLPDKLIPESSPDFIEAGDPDDRKLVYIYLTKKTIPEPVKAYFKSKSTTASCDCVIL